MTREEPDVVCFGAAHWDVIARAQGDAPGPDRPGRVDRRPGGVAFNVARALTAAGCRVALVTPLGDDEEGQRLLSVLSDCGIPTDGVILGSTERTACYVAVEGADGELLTAVADAAALDALTPADLRLDRVLGAKAWFLDANLPVAVIQALAERHSRPSLIADAVSPAKAPRLQSILGSLDTLYCNRGEAEAICATRFQAAETAAKALVARGAARAVVTDGPHAAADAGPYGAVTLRPEVSALHSVTGAGDALLAAHLAVTLQGGDPGSALAAGLAAARRRAA